MTYATGTQLMEAFGEREVAKLAAPDARLDPTLLRLTLAGGVDISVQMPQVTPEEQAVANRAAQRVDQALAVAASRMHRYLAPRHPVPLPAELVTTDLIRVQLDIARWLLAEDRPTREISDRYDRQLRFLRDIQEGKASLAADDATVSPSGAVLVRAGASGIDWSTF